MSGYFDAAYFDPVYFDTGETATNVRITTPDRPRLSRPARPTQPRISRSSR